MPGSTLQRLAAIAATSTLAAVAATGTVHAATREHTSLSIRSAHSTIDAGGHDTVSGSLHHSGHAVTGAVVALLARPAGASSFRQVAKETTGKAGGVAFRVEPTHRTAYELVFRGNPTYAASHSGVVTVSVRPDRRPPTSLSIRLTKSAIDPGGHATVSGQLLSRKTQLGGREVLLQSRAAHANAWHNGARKKTGKHGFVAFVVSPATTTSYRLVFTSHPNYRGSHSGVVTLHVRTPTSLSLVAAATSIEPGSSDALTGTLSTAGGPVVGRTVTLVARPAGATGWSKVATATTDSAGHVGFTVTPAQTTAYRLVHGSSATLTSAVSPVVTVVVRKASSLSIRSAHDSIASGDSDTVSGTLLGQGGAALAGRSVSLMGRSAGGTDAFTLVATGTTNGSGFVSFTVTPAASTEYELVFDGGNEYDGCHSGVVTVTVA